MRQEAVIESYIVRVYRRAGRDPELMVGLVEDVGKNEKKAFASIQELMEILNSRKRGVRIERLNGGSRKRR